MSRRLACSVVALVLSTGATAQQVFERITDSVRMSPAARVGYDEFSVQVPFVAPPVVAALNVNELKQVAARTEQASRFEVPLPDGSRIAVTGESSRVPKEVFGTWAWRGHVEWIEPDAPPGARGQRSFGVASLSLLNRNVTGSILLGTRTFLIQPLGDGLHAIGEVDVRALPRDHPPSAAARTRTPPSAPGRTGWLERMERASHVFPGANAQTTGRAAVIRMAFVLGPGHPSNGESDQSLAQSMVESINQTFTNSGIRDDVEVQLAWVRSIDPGMGTHCGALTAIHAELTNVVAGQRPATGPWTALRPLLAGDAPPFNVIAYVGAFARGCECGWATQGAFGERGVIAVHTACALAKHSLAHELGHVLGLRHQRLEVDWPEPAERNARDRAERPQPFTFYAYGMEFEDAERTRTSGQHCSSCVRSIMAVGGAMAGQNERSCPRVPYWTRMPATDVCGAPFGRESPGQVHSNNAPERYGSDEARRISETAACVGGNHRPNNLQSAECRR